MIKFENYVSLNGKSANEDLFKKLDYFMSFVSKNSITETSSPEEVVRALKKGKNIDDSLRMILRMLRDGKGLGNALDAVKSFDADYWMKTDPNNPPFRINQCVWIKAEMGSFLESDELHFLEHPQIIESMVPIPCSNVNLWEIKFKNCSIILTSEDVEKE